MSFEGEGEGQERDLERGEDWGRGTLHLLTKLPFEKMTLRVHLELTTQLLSCTKV